VPHFCAATADGRRLTRLDWRSGLVRRENGCSRRLPRPPQPLWKQFFGAGLSGVLDRPRRPGESPTHAELLDWLAAEFMEKAGWDRQAYRPADRHVVFYAYQRSAYGPCRTWRPWTRPTGCSARQNPRRLERIRTATTPWPVAGLLGPGDRRPSAFPTSRRVLREPETSRSRIRADQDDRQYRRGVYTHWQRTFLHPMLANLMPRAARSAGPTGGVEHAAAGADALE